MELKANLTRMSPGAPLFRKRNAERGTAVFIVVMALMVLTGAGVWTMHSAGLTDAASGNERAAAQTLYVSEMGMIAGSSYFSIPGYANSSYQAGIARQDPCFSVSGDKFCKSTYLEEMDPAFQNHNSSGTPRTLLDPGAEGSFSEFASNAPGAVIGDFILEMSDPRPVLVEGTGVSDGTYKRVTLTSYGFVRPPPDPGGNLCTLSRSQNAVASQLGMRSHMIIGPLTQ